jgi:Putative metal-binding motif
MSPTLNRAALAAVATAVLAGCATKLEGALEVDVTVAPSLVADCVKLAVLDTAGIEVDSVTLSRLGRNELHYGVVRTAGMPQTVSLVASGLIGANCRTSEALRLNARTEPLSATFPAESVDVVTLALSLPSAALDGDRDGYVGAASGGLDCNDADPAIHPNALQQCDSLVDTNCDGRVACDDDRCTATAECANPPDRLTWSGVPSSALRAACIGPLTLSTANASGPRAATAPLVVTLSGAEFFSSEGCGTAITTTSIPFQATSTTVWVKANVVGAATLTASSARLSAASATLEVQPLPATSLTFDALPLTQLAGTCSGAIMVTLRDQAQQPTTSTTAVMFALSANPSDTVGNFFSDDHCATAISTLALPPGQSAANFFFRSTKAGVIKVPAALTASGSVTVTPDLATGIAFVNLPLSLRTSDSCSSARGISLQLEVQDQFGNRAPARTSLTLTPSATGGLGLLFFDGATGGCTTTVTSLSIAQGASTASFTVRASSVGTGTVTITPSSGSAVSQSLSVAAGDPTQLAFSGAAQSPIAGACSASSISLGLFDASNTPSSLPSALSVTLSTSALPANSNFVFFTQAGCPGNAALTNGALSVAAGQSQVNLFFRAEKTASFSIQATSSIGNASSPGHSIRAGGPAVLSWTSPATTTVTAGQCSSAYTLSLFDAFLNATSFSAPTPLTPSSSPTGLTFDVSPACQGTLPLTIPAGAQSVALAARGTAVGTYQLSASAGGAVSSGTAPLSITAGPPSLTVTLPVTKPVVVAGTCQQFTFERRDAFGNPVNATPLTFSAVPAGLSLFDTLTDCQANANSATSFTMAAGVKSVWARPTLAAVNVTLNATAGGTSAQATLDCTSGAATSVAFDQLPLSRVAGGCSGSLTLHLRDAFGNDAVNDGARTLTVSGGTNVSYFTTADCSATSASSASIGFLANQARSQTFSVVGTTAVLNTLAISGSLTGSGAFTVTPASAAKLAFTTMALPSLPAGGCSGPVTVEIRDAFENPVASTLTLSLSNTTSSGPADTAVFFSDTACATSTTTTVNVNNTSSGSFSFSLAKAPATQLIIVTAAALPVAGRTVTQAWTTVLGPPAKLNWSVAPPATLARFTCAAAATSQLQDAGGNVVTAPVGGLSIGYTSTTSQSGLTFFSDSSCINEVTGGTIAEGLSEATVYVAVTGSGSTDVRATSLGLTSSAAQTVTVAGATGTLAVTSTSADVEAGACVPLTTTRRTSGSALATVGTSTLSFVVSNPAVTLHVGSDCALPTVTSGTIPNGQSTVTLYARGRSAATNTALTVTANDPNAGLTASSGLALTAYPLVRSGTCTISNNQNTCTSTLSPALPAGNDASRTFVVMSARPNAGNARDSFTQCSLTGATVSCSRRNSPGNSVVIAWQTVSFGRGAATGGASVQQLTGSITPVVAQSSIDLALGTAVDPSRSFVLFSHTSALNGGATHVDFLTAKLISGSTVRLAGSADLPALDYVVQVVELAGARVDRASATAVTGSQSVTQAIALSNPVTTRISPLYSARVGAPSASTTAMCKYRFRGVLSGGSFVATRAIDMSNAAACLDTTIDEVAYELIEWPAGSTVETTAQSLTGGSGTWTPAQATVAHRTLVYLPGQGPGGQSGGETSSTQSNLGNVSATVAGLPTVTVQRGATNATSVFSPFAVMFDP